MSGTPSAAKATTTYTYKVRDKDGDEDTDTFTITVETDTRPTLATTSNQNWVTSTEVALTLPVATNGNLPLTYTLAGDLPTGVSFDATTRKLSGTPSAAQDAKTYTYKVRDKDGDEATKKFTIEVEADSAPNLTTTSDQSWIKGIAVSLTLPESSSGNQPLAYELVGDLPTGVSFNKSTRKLSGTPSATQTTAVSYTYKVTDKDGDEDSDIFTIVVEDDSNPTLSGPSDQTWIKDEAVSLTLPESSSGNSPLTYTLAGGLPTGVSFNATSRKLSGTPTATQNTRTYTYKVIDKDGDPATAKFTIEVEADTSPSLTSPSNKTWVEDVAVSLTLPAATSGNQPLTYSVVGDLPDDGEL